MSSKSSDRRPGNQALTEALRAIRRARLIKTKDLAAAMGMPLRSYEHFEAGRSQVSLERIGEFAQATDSDAYAIVTAVLIGSPQFALRAADNKLMTAFVIALKEFEGDLGDDIARISTRSLITAFSEMFAGLVAEVRQQDAWTGEWLAEGSASLGGESPLKKPDEPDPQ